MPSRRVSRSLATSLLITAAGVAVGLLWAARRQPANVPVQAKEHQPARVRVVPASTRSSFDNEPELTALPQVARSRLVGADDYESLTPDELSTAFLSRATESWGNLDGGEDSSDPELDGFQIASIDELTVPEVSDDLEDFALPRERPDRS